MVQGSLCEELEAIGSGMHRSVLLVSETSCCHPTSVIDRASDSHRVDKVTPIEKTMEALVDLKKYILLSSCFQPSADIFPRSEGKIKYIGLSEVSEATLRRAYAIHPIHCVQMEYSPFSLEVEEFGLLTACRELGVAMVAYSPLSKSASGNRIGITLTRLDVYRSRYSYR